jgi:hypothetical protein
VEIRADNWNLMLMGKNKHDFGKKNSIIGMINARIGKINERKHHDRLKMET